MSDMHLQITLTSEMWLVLVEFRSAISEGMWHKRRRKSW